LFETSIKAVDCAEHGEISRNEKGNPFRRWFMTNSEIIMICLTAVIAAAGVVGACIFNNQLSVMQGQLTEMKTSSGLTNRQIALMEADQRPWISLEMRFDEDLTKNESGTSSVIKYTLNNVGKSPAVNVDFMANMIPIGEMQKDPPGASGYSYSTPPKVIDDAVNEILTTQNVYKSRGWGDIMFPNNPKNGRWRVTSGPKGPGFIPGFYIIGCATYKFVGESTVHHTIRVYELTMGAYGQMISLGSEAIPLADLAFFPHAENGSRAN
jgi:hypothetical protein